MRKVSGKIAAIAILALLAQRGHVRAAQNAVGKVYGPALSSCGSWAAGSPISSTSSGTGDRYSYLLWVEGYVSGAGSILASRESILLADTDAQGIQSWMTKYCTDHPVDSLQVAATRLVLELSTSATR